MHSKQKFKIEIPYIISLLRIIKNGGEGKEELKEESGAGENKVITFLEWLKYINAIKIENREIKLTKVGDFYLEVNENDDYIEPLMLYHLCRNPELNENDGHYYFSEIINEYFNSMIVEYDNIISEEKSKKDMIKLGADSKYPNFIKETLTVLSDSETGFGKLGILEQITDNGKTKDIEYELHSYWVEPLVAAYIIYDLWEENQTTMEIQKIINEKYNLGRIFLMDEDAVMETLEEIQALGLINIETIAGLYQIRIDKNKNKDDILDMIIEKA